MRKQIFAIVLVVLFNAAGASARGWGWWWSSPEHHRITLEPSPKELSLFDGEFRVGSHTKIYVLMGHQSEDRIAAETLAEQVEDQTGLKLEILGMKPTAGASDGAIVLARLQDKRVRRFLAKNGLREDQAIGQDGYLLLANKNHVIVAANSGQGLFYGVQTLRQLLQREGKGLLLPAVEIRDWPTHPGVQESVASEAEPTPTGLVVIKWPGQQ